jgi:hypothetical protein
MAIHMAMGRVQSGSVYVAKTYSVIRERLADLAGSPAELHMPRTNSG